MNLLRDTTFWGRVPAPYVASSGCSRYCRCCHRLRSTTGSCRIAGEIRGSLCHYRCQTVEKRCRGRGFFLSLTTSTCRSEAQQTPLVTVARYHVFWRLGLPC